MVTTATKFFNRHYEPEKVEKHCFFIDSVAAYITIQVVSHWVEIWQFFYKDWIFKFCFIMEHYFVCRYLREWNHFFPIVLFFANVDLVCYCCFSLPWEGLLTLNGQTSNQRSKRKFEIISSNLRPNLTPSIVRYECQFISVISVSQSVSVPIRKFYGMSSKQGSISPTFYKQLLRQ